MDSFATFASSARGLARNPLGIIALFIVLVYGFAALVVGASDKLQGTDRTPLIWFLVAFPVLVLMEFGWLVSKHHMKLYAPSDYKSDDAFIQAFQVRAAAALGAATAKSLSETGSEDDVAGSASTVASIIRNAVTADALASARSATVLWVDDRPDNNRFERQSLEALGIKFVLSTSTEDALQKAATRAFDVVISDMGRPPDDRAGYTLLDGLRARRDSTPFVIYAGSRAPQHAAQARKHGAVGSTNRPDELFQMVLAAIDSKRRAA